MTRARVAACTLACVVGLGAQCARAGAMRALDPTVAGAVAELSRSGLRVRTQTVALLSDVRAVTASAWHTARGVRIGGGVEITNASAGTVRVVRSSVDGPIAPGFRGGALLAHTLVRADASARAAGEIAGEVTLAAQDGGRWLRIRSDALGDRHAWSATIGCAAGPLASETGVRLACDVAVGGRTLAEESAVRGSLSAAVAMTRRAQIEVAALSNPPTARVRIAWSAGAWIADLEHTSVLGFGVARAWGIACVSR